MEMKILSKEMVKPSKPTPHHLRSHKLCLFDQLAPETYISAILFYPNVVRIGVEESLVQLKKSLSETLTLYYPLAGRLKNSAYVDCNDEGVLFVQAQAACRLSDFIGQPDLRIPKTFLPFDPECGEYNYALLVAIKVIVFECGGLAISSLMFHKIVDGNSMSTFHKTWGQCHQDIKPVLSPDLFSSSTIFPARQDLSILLPLVENILGDEESRKEYSKRRFVFESNALSLIKSKAASEAIPNPSTTEALTSFLTKKFMEIKAMRGDGATIMMWHAVNLRPRMEPPLPKQSFGNILWLATGFVEEANSSVAVLMTTLHTVIDNLTSDVIKNLQGEEGIAVISNKIKDMNDLFKSVKIDVFKFTSWRSLGLYDINFGWGNPIWLGQYGEYMNFISVPNIVMFQNYGFNGIEAWVTLESETMDALENDSEFLEFASLNPCIEVGKE